MPLDTSKSISAVTYNGANIPLAGGGGVTSLNGQAGDITIVGTGDATVTTDSSTITVNVPKQSGGSGIGRINMTDRESFITPDSNNEVTFFSDDGSVYMVGSGSMMNFRANLTSYATKDYVDQMIGAVENGAY